MSSSYVQGGQSGVIPMTRVPMQYNFLKDDIWNRSMISKETYERADIQTKHIAGKVNVETKRGVGGKPETLVRELFDSTSSPHPEFKELMIQWKKRTSMKSLHSPPEFRELVTLWRNRPSINLSEERERSLEDYYVNNAYDDEAADEVNDDADDNGDDSVVVTMTELCAQEFVNFLESSTDGKDDCEGVEKSYNRASCDTGYATYSDDANDNNIDDYFSDFSRSDCCLALKNGIQYYCEQEAVITNTHLLVMSSVLLLAELLKSRIKKYDIKWLPMAGGCMLVGAVIGFLASFVAGFNIDTLSFNEEIFLSVLLPPIIFEAALSVNKHEFRRRRLAILMFAFLGTLISTILTAYMVFYGANYFVEWCDENNDDDSNDYCEGFTLLDSFVFGSLISSIDPVAILSVLTSLELTEQDTIFIMVFGESLLNDGIAITLFKALSNSYKESEVEESQLNELLGFTAQFIIVTVGSVMVGILCGYLSLLFFWVIRKKLNAAMEVASFLLWTGIPYYIAEELEWSGIVSIVTMGFFMDIYIAAPKKLKVPVFDLGTIDSNDNFQHSPSIDSNDNFQHSPVSPSGHSIYSIKSLRTLNMKQLLLREEQFRLSQEADKHVRFVAHLLAEMSENAIFIYLGLFLFSAKYNWNLHLMWISIVSCITSRAIMVVFICFLVYWINVFRSRCCGESYGQTKDSLLTNGKNSTGFHVSRTAAALQDKKIQFVLVLAGLRGAVSLALVESVPVKNDVNGYGTEFKQEMKAMTSAAMIFTIFIIGGSAYYILQYLDIHTDNGPNEVEMFSNVGEELSRTEHMSNTTPTANMNHERRFISEVT